jgi:hypothetical protein
MFVRTGERHRFSDAEATNPDHQFSFAVSPLPLRDHAAAALQDAQDRYFAKFPEERKRAATLIWKIENTTPDPTQSTAMGRLV